MPLTIMRFGNQGDGLNRGKKSGVCEEKRGEPRILEGRFRRQKQHVPW